MREPDVLIVYTPTDGQAHLFGARRVGKEWKFSGPSQFPASELQEFIDWRVSEGMSCLDCRKAADLKIPGMSAATPVLLWRRGFTAVQAAEAMAQLHMAILNSPDD